MSRACLYCGSQMPPTMRSHAVYCSRLCQSRHYNDIHRDEIREKGRLYRESHREVLRERARRHNPVYYAAHREEMAAASREWRRQNPVLVRLHSRRRFHLNRAGGRLPSDRLLSIRHADQDGRCAYCREEKELELEHLIPVSKGGGNDFDNLLFSCRSCNASKGNKDPAAFTLLARQAGMI